MSSSNPSASLTELAKTEQLRAWMAAQTPPSRVPMTNLTKFVGFAGIIFTHTGGIRGLGADEQLSDCKLCCSKSNTYKWRVFQKKVSSFAVVDCETQLLGISSHTAAKVGMVKEHGVKQAICKILLMVCVIIGLIIGLVKYHEKLPPAEKKDAEMILKVLGGFIAVGIVLFGCFKLTGTEFK